MFDRIGCIHSRVAAAGVLLAGLALVPAHAQTAQKPPAAKPAAAAPAAPAAPAAAPDQPQAAPQVVRTEILALGNWTVTCREFAQGGPPRSCQAALEIVQQQQGSPAQPLLTWTLRPDTGGRLLATLVSPTGVLIAPGVELRFGKAAARTVAYTACDARCSSDFAVDDGFAREIAAAESAEALVTATNGKPVRFTFPVSGFDKALAALRKER